MCEFNIFRLQIRVIRIPQSRTHFRDTGAEILEKVQTIFSYENS